ncbi:MAG: Adaptive-response sensory-kinase SasA [Phycisphaerae bacterium]|nr:Adaptive-response sensory-kinase SasA [Phycisphaerae bacterium]
MAMAVNAPDPTALSDPQLLARKTDARSGPLRALRLASWLGPILALAAAGGIIRHEQLAIRTLEDQLAARSRLKLSVLAETVASYLTHVGLTLRTIAAEPSVRRMRADSREYLAEIYEQNHVRHRLAEVYVVQANFDGTQRPFMTFEHEEHGTPLEQLHSPERELAEYSTQRAQLRQFEAAPDVTESISRPIPLCIGELGLVYSVPIRESGQLNGIVAGMIPVEALSRLIRTGEMSEAALLLDSGGAEVARYAEPGSAVAAVPAEELAAAMGSETACIRDWQASAVTIGISAAQRWRLVLLSDRHAQLAALRGDASAPGLAPASTVLVLGLVAGGLFRTARALLLARQAALARSHELAHVTRVTTISELAAGLAHEINQPLAAIVTFAEACASRTRGGHERPEETLKDLDAIGGQAQRATAIVERIRRFIRNRPPQTLTQDLHGLIREAGGMLGAAIRDARVEVRYELRAAPSVVRVDPVQITQVIVNLMRNAIEAMADGNNRRRELTVETVAGSGGMVECRIRDTGPRLSDEQFTGLFTPFQSSKLNGLGLGLSICWTIVEAHRGRIWAERVADGGLSVHFTLPVHAGGRLGAD